MLGTAAVARSGISLGCRDQPRAGNVNTASCSLRFRHPCPTRLTCSPPVANPFCFFPRRIQSRRRGTGNLASKPWRRRDASLSIRHRCHVSPIGNVLDYTETSKSSHTSLPPHRRKTRTLIDQRWTMIHFTMIVQLQHDSAKRRGYKAVQDEPAAPNPIRLSYPTNKRPSNPVPLTGIEKTKPKRQGQQRPQVCDKTIHVSAKCSMRRIVAPV